MDPILFVTPLPTALELLGCNKGFFAASPGAALRPQALPVPMTPDACTFPDHYGITPLGDGVEGSRATGVSSPYLLLLPHGASVAWTTLSQKLDPLA